MAFFLAYLATIQLFLKRASEKITLAARRTTRAAATPRPAAGRKLTGAEVEGLCEGGAMSHESPPVSPVSARRLQQLSPNK